MTALVRTLCGDVPADTLGLTDSHDHLFLRTPALAGEELDDVAGAEAVLGRFTRAGGRTVVQWSPAGTGRRLDTLTRLSRRSGTHVVAATGRHRRHLYADDAPIVTHDQEDLATQFIGDVRDRRCGLVSLLAAATTAITTGVPIAVHLEGGTAGTAVLDLLTGARVATGRVVLGHLGRNPEPAALLDAASSGAWLCLDLPAPEHGTTADGLLTQLELLLEGGYGAQVLLGADTTTASRRAAQHDAAALVALAGAARERLGRRLIDTVLLDNPARAWSTAS